MVEVKNSRILRVISLMLAAAVLCPFAYGKTIHVDDDATGANDGSSWANAYNYLQDAMADANSAAKPVEIRVAQGIYKPDQGAGQTLCDREATFQLINGVTLKGGYAGFGEPDPNCRDIIAYETILSGDLDGNDVEVADPCDLPSEPTRAENSYHIVIGSGTNGTAALDGFIITAGNANGSSGTQNKGGGMYNEDGSPTLTGCTFTANHAEFDGGGMYNENSSPTLSNCTFTGNRAWDGGGMLNFYNIPTLANCTFNGNSAYRGAGMENYQSNPVLANCTFSSNSAYAAGGLLNYDNTAILSDCTFSGNSADWGGGVVNYRSTSILNNCTFTVNNARLGGGGMYGEQSDAKLSNCSFSANSTDDLGGGILNYWYDSPTVTNCIFGGNKAVSGGGMMSDSNCRPVLTNCTLAGNSAENGCALAFDSFEQLDPSELQAVNCILWDGGNEIWNNDGSTVKIKYSDVQGGRVGVYDPREALVWGEGNIDVGPCFVDGGYWDPNGTAEDPNDDFWVDGDYHLRSEAGRWDPNSQTWVKDDLTSLCIDAGDPNWAWQAELWPHGKRINMGAHGDTPQASMSLSTVGSPANCNNYDSVDVRDLLIICEDWLTDRLPTAADINRDNIVDLHDYALLAGNWVEEIPTVGWLVAYWKMDDKADSTTVVDSSGNGYDGDAQQNTSAISTLGMIDAALTFNGTSDYVSIADQNEWTLQGDFTITLWAGFHTFNPNWWEAAFAGHDEGPGDTNKWIFSYDPADNRTVFHINAPDVDGVVIKANTWAARSWVWYFIAVSRTGNTYTFYRDGVANGSEVNSTRIPDASSPLTIGWAEGPTKFDGAIDDVRIYSKGLSAAEIKALYDHVAR